LAQARGLAREGDASARITDKGGQREKTGGAPCYGRLGKFSILPGDLKIQGGNVSAASREAGEEGQERLRRRCTFGDRESIFECLTGGGEGRFGKMGWEWEISGDLARRFVDCRISYIFYDRGSNGFAIKCWSGLLKFKFRKYAYLLLIS
jgi:hypothetical protein